MIPKRFTPHLIPGVLMAMLVVLVALELLMAATPPVSIDALIHHLAIPKLYLQQGRIYEITHLPFGYYPMNVDLLYMACLYLGNDVAPKILHFLFGLGTAGIIYNYLRIKLDHTYGLLGALLFLSLPIVVRMSGTAYVDLGFLFFCTLALRSLISWVWSRCARPGPLVWSGIWCGLALGTKYNGLVLLFVLALLIPIIFLRLNPDQKNRQSKALIASVLWVGVALMVFSPWMIRNFLWTGNPVYPLYRQQIERLNPLPANKTVSQRPDSALDYKPAEQLTGHFATRYVGYKEPLWQILLIPFRIFFQGQDHSAKYFDGRLNPYLLFLPLLLFVRKKSPEINGSDIEYWVWIWTAVLIILLTFFQTDMRIRYVLPAIPPLVILGVFGVARLIAFTRHYMKAQKRFWNWALCATLMALLLTPNALYLTHRFTAINPLAYLSGKEDRDGFIDRFRPENPVYRYMNRYLPQESLVLGLYVGRRGYYAERAIRFNTDFFWRHVQNSKNTEELNQALIQSHITHLMIRHDLFKDLAVMNHRQHITKINDFFSTRCRKLFAKNGYGLYQLIDAE